MLDFGIAKVLEETRELATDVGRTIAYAAPERLRSERVNVHADFWSLGVMLYEMVSGHRPYPALEDPRLRRQLYSAITNNAPRAPLPPDCPPHLQAIIHRLLAFQPAHRYQTAAEIHADLERYVEPRDAGRRAGPRHAGDAAGAHAAASARRLPSRLPIDRAAPDARRHANRSGAGDRDSGPIADGGAAASAAREAPSDALPALAARRLVNAMAAAALIGVVTTEGVAWLFAERFRDSIAAIDERSVISSHAAYRGVARLVAVRSRSQPARQQTAVRGARTSAIASLPTTGARCRRWGPRSGGRRRRRSRGRARCRRAITVCCRNN